MNPNATHILEKNLDKIDWHWLSMNPNAIHILEKNLDKVYWGGLSANPNAIHILEKNLDKVDWRWLSKNPNAIHILEKNLDKVSWYGLSINPNAIHILEKNLDKVDWYGLSRNSNIFEYDYTERIMKQYAGYNNPVLDRLLCHASTQKNVIHLDDRPYEIILPINREITNHTAHILHRKCNVEPTSLEMLCYTYIKKLKKYDVF